MSDDLTKLTGCGPATEEKLIDGGYDTYMSIAVSSPSDLEAVDVGTSTAQKIIRAAQDAADVGSFDSGVDVMADRQRVGKISFQIPEMDKLFGGGVETGSITEFYGEFGAGKSQVTHQLAVLVQLPEEVGGLSGRCVFIDSEDTFRPERIEEMVRGLEDDVMVATMQEREIEPADPNNEESLKALVNDVLDKIQVAKAFNSNHQILLAEKAKEVAGEHAETDWPVRLVCVDSLTAQFRAEYVGRGELAERQQKLNKHLHDIDRIGSIHDCALVVTNQVAANPDSYFGDPTNPVGGNILGHKSNFRIYIRKSKGNKRVFNMVDAPNLPDGEAVGRVNNDGVKPE